MEGLRTLMIKFYFNIRIDIHYEIDNYSIFIFNYTSTKPQDQFWIG